MRLGETMQEQRSAWIMAAIMSVCGVVGLVLGLGARDSEMAIFGWSLVLMAVLFVAGLARGGFGKREAARIEARTHV
jgi:uncharacterized membrane protein